MVWYVCMYVYIYIHDYMYCMYMCVWAYVSRGTSKTYPVLLLDLEIVYLRLPMSPRLSNCLVTLTRLVSLQLPSTILDRTTKWLFPTVQYLELGSNHCGQSADTGCFMPTQWVLTLLWFVPVPVCRFPKPLPLVSTLWLQRDPQCLFWNHDMLMERAMMTLHFASTCSTDQVAV